MEYHNAINDAARHIGRKLTRSQAKERLSGHALRAFNNSNVMSDEILQYRAIGDYVVEIALVTFLGSHLCGITVFKGDEYCTDLGECVAIDDVAAKLKGLAQ